MTTGYLLRRETMQDSENIVRVNAGLLFTIDPHLAEKEFFVRFSHLVALY